MFSGAKKRLAALTKDAAERPAVKTVNPQEPWKAFLDPIDVTPTKKELVPAKTAVGSNKVVNNLNELIPLALEVHYKILSQTPLNPNSEDYIANARLVLATAQSIMGAQIKVDENQLRSRKQDDILTILQELKDEEKKQALLDLSLRDQ